MEAKMLVDFNEHIRKGDAPPKGREAHFVKIGLAEKVEKAPAATPPVVKKPAPKKPAAKKKP